MALAARYVQLLGPALCMWAVGTCINSYLRSQVGLGVEVGLGWWRGSGCLGAWEEDWQQARGGRIVYVWLVLGLPCSRGRPPEIRRLCKWRRKHKGKLRSRVTHPDALNACLCLPLFVYALSLHTHAHPPMRRLW